LSVTISDITPSWLRARIAAIRKLIEELPTNRDEKNSERTLLRYGIIPESQQKRFDEILDYEYKLSFALNEPLTFTEITSFNTWFVLHPEKVCGKEVITSSREFPVTIKGTKEDIIRTIRAEITQAEEPKKAVNPAQTQFDFDTKHIEPEQEKPINRFGSAKKTLDWTVQEFNSFYYDAMTEFQQTQEPIEKQIAELKQKLKEAGRDRTKRQELTIKNNEAISQLNYNKNLFESDWIDFCTELHHIIIEIAKNKGLHIDEDKGWYIPDDILLAITDRPGNRTLLEHKNFRSHRKGNAILHQGNEKTKTKK
jgi:hypothetical protein